MPSAAPHVEPADGVRRRGPTHVGAMTLTKTGEAIILWLFKSGLTPVGLLLLEETF
jgi:hypothetical protein